MKAVSVRELKNDPSAALPAAREQSTRSLAEVFSEIREICTEENYQFEIGKRRDRKNWIAEDS